MVKFVKNPFNKALQIVVAIIVVVTSFFCSTISYNTHALAYGLKDFIDNLFGPQTQTVYADMPEVWVGGIPLGFTLSCDGVVVIAVGQVHSNDGVKNTIIDGIIEPGDIITHINGESITSVETIEEQMELQNKQNVPVKLDVHNKYNSKKQAQILPVKDVITGKFKLGLWVRDNSAGVGTLTYVRKDNLEFGALGHSVCDVDTGRLLPVLYGNVYKCNIIGVQPSKKGTAGELKGLFLKNGKQIGKVYKNLDSGVFGEADQGLVSQLDKSMKVAHKSQVKTGRASILCTVSGSECREYSIEIIKTANISKESNKSMIIRITDPELINATGGIVQGMSGSPIIQNGMLVGAVTHVFISDPTKGYGIFAQTMLEN